MHYYQQVYLSWAQNLLDIQYRTCIQFEIFISNQCVFSDIFMGQKKFSDIFTGQKFSRLTFITDGQWETKPLQPLKLPILAHNS